MPSERPVRAPRERNTAIPAAQKPAGTARSIDFFDRYDRFGRDRRVLMNLRYEAIIRQNEDVLKGASVLDLACSEGAWSMAALVAGAVHVTGIESRQQKVENANGHFQHYRVVPERYRFIAGDVFEVLSRERVDVDVVLCLGYLYHTMRYAELFHHIRATGANTLIIDSEVATTSGPFIRVIAENVEMGGNASRDRYSAETTALSGRPSLVAIEKMVRVYGFTPWRRSDRAAILRDNPEKRADEYAEGRRATVVYRRGDDVVWPAGASRR